MRLKISIFRDDKALRQIIQSDSNQRDDILRRRTVDCSDKYNGEKIGIRGGLVAKYSVKEGNCPKLPELEDPLG